MIVKKRRNARRLTLGALAGAASMMFAATAAQAQDDCLTMDVSPLIGGENATWTVTGLEPGDRFVVVWGVRLGPSEIVDRKGYCATFGIRGINRRRIAGEGQAGADGVGILQRNIPPGRIGWTIYMQAAKRFTCPDECVSNIVERTLQN